MPAINVRKLCLYNFTCHAATEIEILPVGVHLVTGPNGVGKSSCAEALAVATWGQPLRGKSPWQEGREGSVVYQTDKLRIVRKRTKGGKASLVFHEHGAAPVEFDSMKKAQAALESILGPFDVWRKTSVFSSSDAASITLSTDAERKRLLETLVGSDRFDPALLRCRMDLRGSASDPGSVERSAFGRVASLARTAEADRLRLDAEMQRVRDTEASIGGMPRIPEMPPEPPVPPTRENDPPKPAIPPQGPPPPPRPTPLPAPLPASLEALPACPAKPIRPPAPETPPRPVSPVSAPVPCLVLSEEDNAAINKSMEAHRSVCAEIGKLEMQIGQIATAGVREQANVERLRQQRSLLASGRCPTCEQATDKVLSGLDSRMAEAETICDLTKRQADEERTALQEQLQEVRDLAAEFARRTAAARATAVVNAEATVQRIRDANALAVREHTLAVRAWDTCCHEIAEAHKGMVTAWEAECLHIMRGHEENLRAVEARNAERREAARRERDGWLKSAEDRYEAWKREHAAWLDAENTRTDGHHREMAAWRTACERNRTTFDEANARYNSAVLSWTGACRDREANLKLRAQLDTRLTQARTQAAALGEKLGESISALDETKARAAVLEACERVLGLRGVRATVLGKALVGINAASNAWLSRIPFGDGRRLRIILSATTERKDGGESDAISLLIQKDADEAREYLSCSGGERRRVDIALLLGLADVAAAASGSTPGTLFCDELYDALDQTGIDAVCSLLDTLAKDRAVVVITHDQNLIDHIRPARHFRFDSGGNVSVAA